jgi:arabinose-5-phosphate isomerase
MIKQLLKKQQQSLTYYFSHVDAGEIQKALDVLANCKGVIYFTGIGKSALVAKKAALTLTSTGTKSLYLGATNALHGDIGIVTEQDCFVFFSKSGESDELLQLVPFLRNKNLPLIAVVSTQQSRLAKACEVVVHLPLEKELCPYDLAPTTSSILQGLFGDVVAVALMELKKFPLDQYRQNHPAGRIGKRLIMKVKDLMITGEGIPLCGPEDKLFDELVELSNKKCGCILVIDKNAHLRGIFTDGDLRRALQQHGTKALEMPLGELMSKNPRTIGSEMLAIDAMQLMEANQKSPIMVLPVLEDQKVVGIIKLHDIIQSGV